MQDITCKISGMYNITGRGEVITIIGNRKDYNTGDYVLLLGARRKITGIEVQGFHAVVEEPIGLILLPAETNISQILKLIKNKIRECEEMDTGAIFIVDKIDVMRLKEVYNEIIKL